MKSWDAHRSVPHIWVGQRVHFAHLNGLSAKRVPSKPAAGRASDRRWSTAHMGMRTAVTRPVSASYSKRTYCTSDCGVSEKSLHFSKDQGQSAWRWSRPQWRRCRGASAWSCPPATLAWATTRACRTCLPRGALGMETGITASGVLRRCRVSGALSTSCSASGVLGILCGGTQSGSWRSVDGVGGMLSGVLGRFRLIREFLGFR